jgi:hypothetical protein
MREASLTLSAPAPLDGAIVTERSRVALSSRSKRAATRGRVRLFTCVQYERAVALHFLMVLRKEKNAAWRIACEFFAAGSLVDPGSAEGPAGDRAGTSGPQG